MVEVYKEQIERVKRDQQQYHDTLCLLNEISAKRKKEKKQKSRKRSKSIHDRFCKKKEF